MLESNGYFPLITLPIRVTDIPSTIIDHIITNDHNNDILHGVIKTDLDDYYPLFCSINISASFTKTLKPMFQRNLQKFNCQIFCDDLDNAIKNFFQSNNDSNLNNCSKLFNDFVKIVQDTIDFYAP